MHKYVFVAKIIIIIIIEHGLTYMFEKCRINESIYTLTAFIAQKCSMQSRHYERTLRLKELECNNSNVNSNFIGH